MGIRLVTAAVTYLVAIGLLVFGLRRAIFSVAAIIGSFADRPRNNASAILPTVTLVTSARDEGSSIAETLEAIAKLDYPPDKLEVVMVDDYSTDRTPQVMRAYARTYANFQYYRVQGPHSLGKAAALNEALRRHEGGEIIYVLDADSLPDPQCVRAAVQHFAGGRAGAVSGAPFPSENCSTFASYYAYLETLVHQSVTTRAKDILGLAPPIFGSNCAYRRSALDRVGGFKNGAFLEDSDLVLALYSGGYTIHFEPGAVSHLAMPRTVSSYFRQHSRWTRGFNDVLGARAWEILRRKELPLVLRFELCLFASGYLDRVLLVAGLALAATGRLHREAFGFPRWVLAASFLSPLSTIIAALLICREPLARHWRLPLVPLFFAVDVASTVKGMLDGVVNKPRAWHRVDRAPQIEPTVVSADIAPWAPAMASSHGFSSQNSRPQPVELFREPLQMPVDAGGN